MTQTKSPGLWDDSFGTEHIFQSWDEFFEDCERLHARGVPYSLLVPAPSTVALLGPMPTPPWVEDFLRSNNQRGHFEELPTPPRSRTDAPGSAYIVTRAQERLDHEARIASGA